MWRPTLLVALALFWVVIVAAALDDRALAFCKTTNVEELPWDPSHPGPGLALLEEALAANCGFEEYASPHRHVWFLKTHKTASSTLYWMIVRKGLSMNATFAGTVMSVGKEKTFWREAQCPSYLREVILKKDICVEMSARHIFKYYDGGFHRSDCSEEGQWLLDVYGVWRELFAEDVAVVIPTREPMSHLLSLLSFYHADRHEFVARKENWSPLAQDIHLFSEEHVDNFIDAFKQVAERKGYDSPDGLHVIVLERVYESLVALRHRLHWNLRDMVGVRLTHPSDLANTKGEKASDLEKFDYKEEETLAVDSYLYKRMSEVMQASWKAVSNNSSTSSLNEEAFALMTITHNVNELALPLFPTRKRNASYSRIFPLLSTLCRGASEEAGRAKVTKLGNVEKGRQRCEAATAKPQ